MLTHMLALTMGKNKTFVPLNKYVLRVELKHCRALAFSTRSDINLQQADVKILHVTEVQPEVIMYYTLKCEKTDRRTDTDYDLVTLIIHFPVLLYQPYVLCPAVFRHK